MFCHFEFSKKLIWLFYWFHYYLSCSWISNVIASNESPCLKFFWTKTKSHEIWIEQQFFQIDCNTSVVMIWPNVRNWIECSTFSIFFFQLPFVSYEFHFTKCISIILWILVFSLLTVFVWHFSGIFFSITNNRNGRNRKIYFTRMLKNRNKKFINIITIISINVIQLVVWNMAFLLLRTCLGLLRRYFVIRHLTNSPFAIQKLFSFLFFVLLMKRKKERKKW